MNDFLILGLAAVGFLVSSYLLKVKLLHEKLVCFLGEDCDVVVKSKYGATFGIPNELFGVLYYAGMFAGTLFSLPIVLLQTASILALSASLFLVLVQAFFLKKWCEWCMSTALVNLLLFLLVI